MNLKILNNNVPFSKTAGFSKKLTSSAGSVFSASTAKGKPTIRIRPEALQEIQIREHVMRIPLRKKSYRIERDVVFPGPRRAAVIGGPRPRKPEPMIGDLIVIGGPRPKPENPKEESEPFFIELDATKGNWLIEPEGNFLNISFDGRKSESD